MKTEYNPSFLILLFGFWSSKFESMEYFAVYFFPFCSLHGLVSVVLSRAPPREGANVHSLYMEGARWDTNLGVIAESRLKEMFPMMPVIHIRALTLDKQDIRMSYECPVYKTRTRGPTYVWTFNLKTKEKPAKWVLAGVGILLCI